jgi:uncharacterized membrane protein YgcG
MRRVTLAILAFLFIVSGACAGERIADFTSDATVNPDASLTVRETIVWEFRDVGAKRGIFRDFPTRYKDRRGLRVVTGFEVLSVKRDGATEKFAIEGIANGERIRIGSADVLLNEGQHTYEITYRTTRQLGFFDNFDELYWNVTGNAWPFPIDHAAAIVRLPTGARILQHASYTGPQGASGKAYRETAVEGGVYRAETTGGLGPGEGLTIAVGFTKGIVTPPTDADKMTWFLTDNASFGAMALSIVAVFLYFLWAWLKVGRDPPKGTIIPLFAPPDGMGPSGLRYVWKEKFDDKGFASALVGLAVKGRVKIADYDGDYSVNKLADSGPPLLPAERSLYQAMKAGTTKFVQTNYRSVGAMRSALEKALKGEFDGVAFMRNLGWSFAGLAVSIAGLLVAALVLPGEEAAAGLFMAAWMAIWWGGILTVLIAGIRGLFARGIASKAGAIFKLLFMIPFVFAGTAAPTLMLSDFGSLNLYALLTTGVTMALLNLIFFRLMRAPTVAGRRVLDRIEGFRMYMKTAEEDRLNLLNPPEKTPQLFEKYLPYALALDCENEWAEKFAAILAAAGIAAPAWYAGSNWDTGNLAGFTDSLGSSLASSTAAASSPPGSSSGSSGGGSSGGGGGGGGGGSW